MYLMLGSPGPGFAASLQLARSIPSCPYIEYPCDPSSYSIDIWQMLLTEEIRIDKHGYLPVPQKPGLGVDVNERSSGNTGALDEDYTGRSWRERWKFGLGHEEASWRFGKQTG